MDAKKSDALKQTFENKTLLDLIKDNFKPGMRQLGQAASRNIDDYVSLINAINKLNPIGGITQAITEKQLGAVGIDPDRPLSGVYADQKGDEAALSQRLSLLTDPFLLYAPTKGAVQGASRKIPDVISDIKYKDPKFSATRGALPEPTSVGADVSSKLPGIELIENLKTKTDRLGRPFISDYQEKLKLLKELDENKYIDPRTNKVFKPEDWLSPKKLDGTPYSEKAFGTVRSKIRQGPNFLDKKAAYQRDYMRARKESDPEFAKKTLNEKKEAYYASARKNKDINIPTPGKSVLTEERNRLLSYMSNKKDDVYKSGKFVGVKDPETGITYLEAGYKGPLKLNEKLISDHPESAHILDLISVAKKFKTDLPSKTLKSFFKDFKRLPSNAELFNFLSADKKFRGKMQKKRFTDNPLEIHHMLGKDVDASKHLQLTLRDRNDYAGKVVDQYKRGSISYDEAVKKIKKLNVRVKLPGDKKFVGGKELTALASLKTAKTRTTKMVKKEIKENPQFADELKTFYNKLYGREEFEKGGRVKFSPFGGLVESVQDEIKEIAASDTITRIKKPVEKKFEEIQQDAKTQLRTERPVKFKASEFTNVAEELVFKPAGAVMTAPMVGGLNAIEFLYNKSRQGVENDIDMKEKFPQVYKLFNYYTSGIGPTPDEQTYIGFLDETIRSVQKGSQNLGYSVLDLAYTIPDFAFDTKLQERLKTEYDKHAFSDPETFLGNAGSILVEFGVPSGVGLKFVNFMRKGLQKTTGLNLFTRSTYGMKGAQKAATTISNVAKRVGVVAPSAFIGEFVGGSQYNTVSREFADDPLFLDQTLGYDFIDTTNLSGRELQVANFTNRLRFGADGAVVAGMFPLVGPALFKATKYGVIKPSAYVAGKGLQAVNYLGIKPVSYLLARTPGVAQAGQLGAQALGLGASFLGKDIISRAAIGFMGTPTLKQLPDFKDWRMFEVTSSDPVERNLRKFDNFLSLFRDSANQSANRFFITGQTDRKIKALSRKIEKQLDSVEVRAYDLATGFLKDYNSKTTSPAKQQYYLDQVMAYMKGQIKKTDLPEPLQESAEALNKTFMEIKRDFADILPEGAGLKDFLNSNLRQYMRASFATFTNPLYRPDKQTFDRAVDFMVDRINKNENMVEAAIRASNQPTDVAIKEFARKQVESMLQRGKADNRDPLDVLSFIARQNLKMDDLVVQTGEELPAVIRKLMGEENTLRGSVMMTATDLASQTANLQMYNKLTKLGLDEGWLFRSADEALASGVINPKLIGPRLPGLGKLNSDISEVYGSEDIVNSIVGSSGLLDGLLKNNLYQSLIAYKAMVQTGKTVYSPATQTRNFGSAGFFPLQSGHIGGSASVQDAFKIMLDDIFGAGRVANEQQLIDRITRKIELGVLDENVVVSELKDILQDLKKAKFKSFGELAERIDNTRLSQTATRLYAGGDNVWKWYGHEFVMSQLKNGFKNVDELVKEYKQTFKVDINPKTLEEGIEQYAATLIRDTYPTYSKVPKAIQLIRRVPFIGNFVSFPAEILRTTFTTSALAAKHIMSNNPTLRELGYRTLMGQYITYGGIGAGVTYLGQSMSNLDSQQIKDLKEYFVPEFMRYSDLVPLTPMEDGVVKVFDNSRYFPYDLITSTTGNLINRMFTQREKLDPDKIETDMFKDLYNYTGPFADLAGGTLFGTAIGYEPALTFLTDGRTKTGSRIYAKTDTTVEKFDKMFAYTFETINPGFVRTLQNLYRSFAGMLTGTGQPIKPEDEVFKLFGGSAVTIDVPGSFRFKIGNLKASFREPKVAEDFFRPDFRTAAQLVREYNDQNEEAFREQYEFFKLVRAAKRNNFMSNSDMIKVLSDRVGKKTAANIISGRFTPLSYSKDALKGRFENVKRGNPEDSFSVGDFLPFAQLERAKAKWSIMKFEDFEREMKEPEQVSAAPVVQPQQTAEAPDAPVAPLPDTPAPTVSPVNVSNAPRATTGLTDAESVYLGPTEQLYRRRERGVT